MSEALKLIKPIFEGINTAKLQAEAKAVELASRSGESAAKAYLNKAYKNLEIQFFQLKKLEKEILNDTLYIEYLESENFGLICKVEPLQNDLEFSELAVETFFKKIEKMESEAYDQTFENFMWAETNFSKFSIWAKK